MASFCPGILWSIIWVLILWFLMWPIAGKKKIIFPIIGSTNLNYGKLFINKGFLSWIWILLMPFEACCPCLKPICQTLLKWIQYCETVGENIKGMKSLCG
jgi:phosphate/sulfate permease